MQGVVPLYERHADDTMDWNDPELPDAVRRALESST
jgi:hypothetical protein